MPGATDLEALVDTGADECCIDHLLAAQLALPVVDKQPMVGIHGSQQVNIHLAQIHVPALRFTVKGSFAAVPLAASGARFKALMGRTFLRYFRMTYEGRTGDVIMERD